MCVSACSQHLDRQGEGPGPPDSTCGAVTQKGSHSDASAWAISFPRAVTTESVFLAMGQVGRGLKRVCGSLEKQKVEPTNRRAVAPSAGWKALHVETWDEAASASQPPIPLGNRPHAVLSAIFSGMKSTVREMLTPPPPCSCQAGTTESNPTACIVQEALAGAGSPPA